MSFYSDDRPNMKLVNDLMNNRTPFSKISFINSKTQSFIELLASEQFKRSVNDVKEYIGEDIIEYDNIFTIMIGLLNDVLESEKNHKNELEILAKQVTKKYLGLRDDDINLNPEIKELGEIDDSGFIMPDKEIPINDNEFVEEKNKRRLTNSIVQGSSVRGQYLFHTVEDELKEITGDVDIVVKYGIIMSVNNLLYWLFDEDLLEKSMGGNKFGKSTIKLNNKKDNDNVPEIKAEGLIFPVLLHELIKGVQGVVCSSGLPKNPEIEEKVKKSEDTMMKEVWDIRIGPSIWQRLRNMYPEEVLMDEKKSRFQSNILFELVKFPASEFLLSMKEILGQTNKGKKIIDDLYTRIKNEIDNSDDQDESDDDLDNPDDGLKGFLGNLGIGLSNN